MNATIDFYYELRHGHGKKLGANTIRIARLAQDGLPPLCVFSCKPTMPPNHDGEKDQASCEPENDGRYHIIPDCREGVEAQDSRHNAEPNEHYHAGEPPSEAVDQDSQCRED